ncbi:uncharacterized protein G2W53_036804 [Senna tora]|uniref:Uncharacterized protein n=1 Tax=Senna tora TaxID=362788 RepID=A0A834SW44_9FABA|nr:uncharacterized protein G2W53_036804 [Senna tora]
MAILTERSPSTRPGDAHRHD